MPEPATSAPAIDTFDDQATAYDARAGLPAAAAARIARAIVEQTGAGPLDLVVDVGAGTGELGAHLLRLPPRYVGLDASAPMLRVFRDKDAGAALILADGARRWPLADGVATVVVASRVSHLLDPDHVAREALRVGRGRGWLILGRVVRDRAGLKERLRRRRLELLAAAGLVAPEREDRLRGVVARCQAAGGESLGRRVVAEWSGETTPATIIAGWESLSRMGSVAVDPATRARILDALRQWARAEYGDLERPQASQEGYAIEAIRLP